MKACVLHAVNNLKYEDVPYPKCPENWVVVQVKAAGICSSDISRIMKNGTYHFPTIPGHEFSGIVVQVSGEKNRAWIGKRVGIFPLIPCKNCAQCQKGHYEMCENYDYIGSRRDGGFAEYVAVPVWNLIELPENVSFVEGAMLEPLSVALHAVRLGNIQKGNSIMIIGTGMIGIAAALWAKKLGAGQVYVCGRTEEKKRIVEQFDGISYLVGACDAADDEYDIVIEAVGTPETINQALHSTVPGGRIVLMGNPSGDICLPKNTYWRILRKQLQITGTWNSSYGSEYFSDWLTAIKSIEKGEMKVESLVTHYFNQNDLERGIHLMAEHTEMYCKVMTIWNQEDIRR